MSPEVTWCDTKYDMGDVQNPHLVGGFFAKLLPWKKLTCGSELYSTMTQNTSFSIKKNNANSDLCLALSSQRTT